ncbi:hypothetical protein CENSYa_1148 [Cenarchaeum symbiosum A]|uniref:Nitroreductase family deazaflavin-dependent oxidoreductase n=1 Tax=Cenarchaeum symbiosum (strain A) TaxID=414004 RepID=A0RWQ8_CENSY|nr:hypothetical protein CENSYa_1148 [Cenarchaeum symbiosum A]
MDNLEGTAFRAVLYTTGRKTGREHAVKLRAVMYQGKVYFSRHRPDSDWFQNAVADPRVKVGIGDASHEGRAAEVTDAGLGRKISELKYPGEPRASENRVSIGVTLS